MLDIENIIYSHCKFASGFCERSTIHKFFANQPIEGKPSVINEWFNLTAIYKSMYNGSLSEYPSVSVMLVRELMTQLQLRESSVLSLTKENEDTIKEIFRSNIVDNKSVESLAVDLCWELLNLNLFGVYVYDVPILLANFILFKINKVLLANNYYFASLMSADNPRELLYNSIREVC